MTQPYEHKLSVEEMCSAIGWNVQDLAHEARIAWQTANNAYQGREPSQRTKRDICSAFSRGFHREVSILEIAWSIN